MLQASALLPWASLTTAPKISCLGFIKAPASDKVKSLRRRVCFFTAQLDNLQLLYTVNLGIGTPPQ